MQRFRFGTCQFIGKLSLTAAVLLSGFATALLAQQDAASHPVELGIIVTCTEAEAVGLLQQLNAGWDFGVLAKEKSIDPTSNDGGYMGSFSPSQLRPELRDALAGHTTGQLSGIIPVSNGFAILKILPAAPATEDPNIKHIQAMIASGEIRFGANLSGLTEADSLFRSLPKPDGWERDLRQSCNLRTQSYDMGMARLTEVLNAAKSGSSSSYGMPDVITLHIFKGQLYAYAGKMEESIRELKIAYELAQALSPAQLPTQAGAGGNVGMGGPSQASARSLAAQLQEILGDAYLHWAEMENGVYRNSTDFDIFPPVNPKASYEKKDESRLAIQYFTQYLTQFPDDLEVKWLLNLAYSTLGEYPAGVPKAYLIPESDFESKENIGRFVDVAPAAGLNVMREAGGVVIDDFENNGLLDIIVSSMEVCDPIKYFHNNGDGTFSDRTVEASLADQLGALNIIQVDYNNDGCMDLFIPRGGWEYPQKRSLMRNNCDGTFTDVTEASGLGDNVSQTNSVAWADIDNDGYLDLFIANENSSSQLFHNKGDGTFEDISHAAGIDQNAFAKGVTAADYDQDGYVDFYVSNLYSANKLYHNNGNLTFTDVARQAGVQAPLVSFSTWFFDYDNDGWPDLFVTSYVVSVPESLKTYVGLPHNAETLKLYRNKHDGTFEDVTEKVGLDKVFMPMGSNFGDVHNDGFLDIYLGMGNPSYTALLPHTLLLNKEGKSFVDITASSGTGELHKGHGIAFADLDRSGNEAIVAETGGAVPGDAHTLRVFQNPGNDNDWINVHLVGVKSNRSGVGAQIKITVTDDGQAPRPIYRTVGETSSFGSNPLEQHIGLGHNAQIVAVDVWWPATNTRQHFTGVDKNQYIEIKEFANEVAKLNRPSFHLGGPATAAGKRPDNPPPAVPIRSAQQIPEAKSISGTGAAQAIQVDFSTNPNPLRKGSNIFRVKLSDGKNAIVSGAEVAVTFFMPAMPDMAMDAVTATTALTGKSGGLYEGTGDLAYGGTWQVAITVKQNGQLIATKNLNVHAEGGM
jgi:tetratricopeptide (TPR) repeat protein